jgi:hypothetical protein
MGRQRGESSLYEKHGINPTFDSTGTYGTQHSYYGNGKYPPDWENRREAVWERQNYQCARCGVYKGDVPTAEVHHLVHLQQGGSNELSNLVGLCLHCHALMHPGESVVTGSSARSDLFPEATADDRVAVIRRAIENDAANIDFDHLAAESDPDRNRAAVTEQTVATSAETAKRAARDLHELLRSNGYVPRTGRYHALDVTTTAAGIRGLVTRWSPEIAVDSDAEVVESDPDTVEGSADYLLTPEATEATVAVTDVEETTTTQVEFAGEEAAEREVAGMVTPPPLSASTAPTYAWDFLVYVLLRGALPGAALAYFQPGLLPTTSWWASWLGFTLLVGLGYFLLRAMARLR